jgi:8-oxo-dGTP pyrophosphatase MutT (NUDIX family)
MDAVTAATPTPAATVVLLRDTAPGMEVLLVRRHDQVAFMGGAHVFPGGRVEPADLLPDVDVEASLEELRARMPDVDRELATGLHVAAMRELFEEAGILLARDGTGTMVSLVPGDAAERVRVRAGVADGTIAFAGFVRSRGWHLAVEALAYVAHWVTPAIDTRRFDTRFFLAIAPAGQDATHDAGELTDSAWLRPAEAIARCVHGEIALPPPTWTMLRWLEGIGTAAEAIRLARQRRVPRVEPGFIQRGATRLVLLPGDPECPPVAGFAARETRFVLSAGRWRPIETE